MYGVNGNTNIYGDIWRWKEIKPTNTDIEAVYGAADPGIVSTDIITMHMWFDPLTDILFRPFIRTPRQGAATAVHLLLDEDGKAGYLQCHRRSP